MCIYSISPLCFLLRVIGVNSCHTFTLLPYPLSFYVCPDPSPWRGTVALYNSKVAVMDSGVIEGGLNVTLTIRLLMHGKVRSTISLSCQESIFYDLLFMERSALMWCVTAEESDVMCVKPIQGTSLNPQSRLIKLEVCFIFICTFSPVQEVHLNGRYADVT